MRLTSRRPWVLGLCTGLVAMVGSSLSRGGEPDPKSYWDVADIRPGMKGVGRTVMVGTKLEEFKAEVLGVMRDVSPGRDMVLCRLTGCDLEHAGIIQGMSGSPIVIEGKLLGAVAFAWEFAKDPIAGVTPFSQMIKYVRSNDRRIAAESHDREKSGRTETGFSSASLLIDGDFGLGGHETRPMPVAMAAAGAGMTSIMTPLSASGFSPRSMAMLSSRLAPLGMSLGSGGSAPERIVREEGDKPLVPGSPLSIAMVMGDFDLSGIGTVTHVEGDRVYGFGHPMLGLGACELPMMTGYIHTVYPRASVSMKMGSPLKIVGVIDTDVSTSVSGRIGPMPDLLPLSVRVKTGRFAESRTYKVRMVREPTLLPTLVLSVLTNAIDTEGNLPEELTARLSATIKLKGMAPITLSDELSGARYTGMMGASALFGPVASIVGILTRNPMASVRIESIDCDVSIEPGRRVAQIESARLISDTIEPGGRLRAVLTLKPFKGERFTIETSAAVPTTFPEGPSEVVFCDMANSVRRAFRNDPTLLEPHDLGAILRAIRVQIEPKRTNLYVHIPSPERAVSVRGLALPNLPGSARAVFASKRETGITPLRSDLVSSAATDWVVEGSLALKFTVAKDPGLSLSLPGK